MTTEPHDAGAARDGWAALLSGRNFVHAFILAGGVMLHAVNIYIVTTILPSVVGSIGGLDYYAWSTTLFVVASILGAALSGRLLDRAGAGRAYLAAALLFAAGGVVCAIAPAFPVLLTGRFVQGFGGGLLYALAYGVIRLVFPEALWSRAIGLISIMWGAATLVGPAVGGVFAEYDIWRAAFWSPAPVALLFGLVAVIMLPKRAGAAPEAARMPVIQLVLLVASVLAVSMGSVSPDPAWNGAGLAVAAAAVLVLLAVERKAQARLLPSATFGRGGLAALYVLIFTLVVGMQSDIFVPYFLQMLHGQQPLAAGYFAALMAIGWTLGSLASGGRSGDGARTALRLGPVLVLAGLVILAIVIPVPGAPDDWRLLPAAAGLLFVGLGIGVAWPHLVTHVFRRVPATEQGLGASSITTVQLFATAFGAAAAGMLANIGGLTAPGGAAGAAGAALWLFAGFVAAPLIGIVAAARATRGGAEPGETAAASA